ncbi:MAG: transposase [Patescibacteria group bacterium]|nr:transposase [Patescibacteria group bacterium]
MSSKRGRRYDSKFKLQMVLETLDRNTTINSIKKKYDISNKAITSWRKKFFSLAHTVFDKKQHKIKLSESPEELKKIIGELTVQNEILKKYRFTNLSAQDRIS